MGLTDYIPSGLESKFLIIIFLIFILISICWSPMVRADTLDIGVTSEVMTVMPGSFKTVIFTVQNEGIDGLKLKTGLKMPENWMTVSSLPLFNLSCGETANIPVTFQPSVNSTADKPYKILFFLQNNEGEIVAQKSITVNLKKVRGVKISSPGGPKSAPPGSQIEIPLFIINQGNLKDTFAFKIQTNLKYQYEVKQIMLSPGERQNLKVSVSIPDKAREGNNYILTITAKSINNESIQDILKTKITVSPRSIYPGKLYEYLSGKIENVNGDVKLGLGGVLHLPDNVTIKTYLNKSLLKNNYTYRLGLHTKNIGIDIGNLSTKINRIAPDYSFSGFKAYYQNDNHKINIFEADSNLFGVEYINKNTIIPFEISFVNAPDIDPDKERDVTGRIFNASVGTSFLHKFSLKTGFTMSETPLYKFADLSPSTGQKYFLNIQYNGAQSLVKNFDMKYNYISSGFLAKQEEIHDYSFSGKAKIFPNNFLSLYYNRNINSTSRLINDKYLLHLFSIQKPFKIDYKYQLKNNLSDNISESNWIISLIKTNKKSPFFFISEDSKIAANQSPKKRTMKFGLNSKKKFGIFHLNTRINYVETQFRQNNNNYNYINSAMSLNMRKDNFSGNLYSQIKYYNPERIDMYSSLNFNYQYNKTILDKLICNLNIGTNISNQDKYSYYGNLNVRYDPVEDISSGFNLSYSSKKKVALLYYFKKRFNLPIPWIKARGKPAGRIFVDNNNNGIFDEGESGIAGVKLLLNSYQLISSPDGRYTFPPLNPGNYKMNINLTTLPAGLKSAQQFPYSFKIERGEIKRIDIPLIQATSIKGRVDKADYKNAQFTGDKIPLGGIKILLYKGDQFIDSFFTLNDGTYLFENLKPGLYQVRLVKEWLPKGLTPEKGYKINVQLKTGKASSGNNFVLKRSVRKIIKTFSK